MAGQPEPSSLVEDPFDTLLTLEDSLYTNAYELGVADGAHAGRIEGRIFGLEKGFEKFASMGQLHGRACVWGARLPSLSSPAASEQDATPGIDGANAEDSTLPPLKGSERLGRNVSTLHGLTDPLTFSTLNTEDAVADFDDRFKRAGAKAKIIERTVLETEPQASPLPTAGSSKQGPKKGRNVKMTGEDKKKGTDDSMEDFAGSRFLA